MKQWRRSLQLLAAIVVCHQAAAMAGDDIEINEVADGIFLYQGPNEQMTFGNLGAIGNTGFIVGEQSVAVIDSGGSPEFGRRLRNAVKQVTDLPIEYLILTHFHPDHVAGAVAFPEALQLIAHENYERAMTQRALFYVERFTRLLPRNVEEAFLPSTTNVSIGQTMEIDLGGRILIIEAHALAHTDNDISVHDLKTNTFWASDLLFAQRTPALDGSLTGWLEVLSTLDERNYGLTIPGHGTPAQWSDLLKPHADYLHRLKDDVRAMLDKGQSLSEVLQQHEAAAESYPLKWALYAEQHGSNLAKAYTELEWE